MARSETLVGVNTERLLYARNYYNLSLEEVCQKSKIHLEKLCEIENGTQEITYNELSKLAELYNRPILYFFFPDSPKGNLKMEVAFRTGTEEMGTFGMQGRLMMEKANEYRMNLTELFKDNKNCAIFCEILDLEHIDSDKKFMAFLREKLNLSIDMQKNNFNSTDKLLEYIRGELYKIGIYVFKDSFRDDAISGLCLYDNFYPIILLNNKTTFTRQLFTLFHEICHTWKHEIGVSTTKQIEEDECDKFAGEFLIPDDDLVRTIGTQKIIDILQIRNLADIYKVSQDAMAYRLKELKRITLSLYKSVHSDSIRKSNSDSSGGNYYYTKINYLGKPYLDYVFDQYYGGRITTADVGKYTGIKASNVTKLSAYFYREMI